MRSLAYKGKVHGGFPFSFLRRHGELDVESIHRIKPHVHKIRAFNKDYILKRYESREIVQQQWDFFERLESPLFLPFILFPNGKQYINGEDGGIYTLADCMNGSTLSYTNEKDRKTSHDILYHFHKTAQGIELDSAIPKLPLYLKWQKRLQRFLTYEGVFHHFGQSPLFHAIAQKSYAILSEAQKLDWTKIEEKAIHSKCWTHGDVASHNFIRSEEHVRLIDFDLLGQSPLIYDWIQLAQRWMYDVSAVDLLNYRGFRQFSHDPLLRLGIAFPSDVMREWLCFIRKQPSSEMVYLYLEKLNQQWTHREIFVERLSGMLT